MKKIICVLFVCVILLVGCGEKFQNVTEGTYTLENSENAVLKPKVTFNNIDQSFTFMYDPFSSYLSFGKFTVEDSIITARTEDDKYIYRFEILDEKTIAFLEKRSSELDYAASADVYIVDGSKFILS